MATYDEILEHGLDILSADGLVGANAHHKLPVWLRAQVSEAVEAAGGLQDAQGLAEGTRRVASNKVKSAYRDGEKLIREFNRFVNGLNDNQDEEVDIAAVRSDYGLGRVLTSDMTHAFVKSALAQIQRVAPDVEPAVARPRATVLARMAEVSAIIQSEGVSASVGQRSSISGDKKAAQQALEEATDRVRYFLWATLPEMFKDPLLHDYGFVPRQESQTQREEPPV